ncbi:hypothetical protein V1508DRAFT_421995 [Lipomyces doorenjongii]|uniref:uncharacterized protein n=1 Tax=Lipomyces doorenjongii TaxID=383834 RepID=UPI0034CF6C1F
MCNTSSSMEERYKESSLARQLELVSKLFTWKSKKSENPDKWLQEWCDVLKRFLNMQTDKEYFWKVVMLNNFPEEYGAAISSGVNNDKKKETRTCYACGNCWSPSEGLQTQQGGIDGTITKMRVHGILLQVRVPSTSNTTSTTL